VTGVRQPVGASTPTTTPAVPAPTTTPAVPAPAAAPSFAHHSEAEFARILDFYEVRWEYEPHVYPILWSIEGAVQESFAPDFYLPDLDLYVELTTLRQRLVRKKNRKLRRLRELYPDIRIKLFYERDFRALMLKYGKLAIADELSGTGGQVSALHPAADVGRSAPDPMAPRPAAGHVPESVALAGPAIHAAAATDPVLGAPALTRGPRRTHEATAR